MIEKLNDSDEAVCSSNNGYNGNSKKQFSVIIATVATRKKTFIKNLNLIDLKNHQKIGSTGSVQGEIKGCSFKNSHF